MKKIVYSMIAFATLSMTSCGNVETPASTENKAEESPANSGVYSLAQGSTVTWKAKHNFDADYVHIGTLNVSGFAESINGIIAGGAFEFDMNTINKDGENSEKLVGHLMAEDFFSVATYPKVTFTITGSSNTYVDGNLTVLGVTKELRLPVTTSFDGDKLIVSGTALVNFLDFGLGYLVAGDALSDEEKAQGTNPEAAIEINLELTKMANV